MMSAAAAASSCAPDTGSVGERREGLSLFLPLYMAAIKVDM
jgi:hypothetical protein